MSANSLAAYADVVGNEVISQLHQIAEKLQGRSVVHVNSTRSGGGVAEILEWLVPLMRELGLDASWEVIEGNPSFFEVTKKIHNALQGISGEFVPRDEEAYKATVEENVERLGEKLAEADYVFIHDPQPAPLIGHYPERGGRWIWRCHIDVSRPSRSVWKMLQPIVSKYEASIFSMPQFAQLLPHMQFLIPPSIDPLSEKNREMDRAAVETALGRFGLDLERPVLTQVSRFDRFKDPIGVIRAFQMVKVHYPVQLVLAGGGATDDPEGAAVLEEVKAAANGDEDIHILMLPPNAHTTINALQQASEIIIQKSTKEGFGLTVTEGMWKKKPIIGGDVGGIRLQVHDFQTGFLVNSPEGAALRIRYLFQHPALRSRMGECGWEFVRDNFLLTRHLHEYLTLMLQFELGDSQRIIHL